VKIDYGKKIVANRPSGKSRIEISRHPNSIMDNILIVNRIGKEKESSWMIEKDLETWLNYLKAEGFTKTKIVQDVETSKKNIKKKR
jgi:hypothetical protein